MLLHTTSLLFILTTSTAAAVPVVDTSLGRIVGTTDGSVDSFLGIQYAQVGPRFARSTLVDTPWQDGMNATSYAPYCWQSIPPGSDESFTEAVTSMPQDEECLYLNIWRPATNNSNELLPTMVYTHGGGFNFGSGAEPIYNGASLARDYNVVLVTTNYRVGMFGFLVTGENGKGGLNGLHDQINALQWIHNHIESFGGDKNDVTLFGESAGSMAVCMLNVSPLAQGLFHRSIQQSGECAVGIAVPNTPQAGAQNTQTILDSLNASSVDELANATLYPAEMIAPYSSKSLIGWHTVDGWVLPKQPKELYSESSNIVATDMIVGSNSFDSASLLILSPVAFISAAMNMETEVNSLFGPEYGDTVMQAYSSDKYGGNLVAAYAQFWGDLLFRCGMRQFAAFVAEYVEGNVYLYNYAHLSSVDPIVLSGLKDLADINDTMWASHAADIPMIFNTSQEFAGAFFGDDNSIPLELSTDDVELSKEMRDRWIKFVKTGDPNVDGAGGDNRWEPVPLGANTPGPATSIPTFLLQSGGGKMSNVTDKVQQCSIFGFSPPPSMENATKDTSGVSKDWLVGAAWLVALVLMVDVFV